MSAPVAVLLYPGCIFFEVALAAETLAPHRRVLWYTPDGAPHRASNGATITADGRHEELPVARPAAVLVPGGDPRSLLLPVPRGAEPLQQAAAQGAWMAGICAGTLVLAAAGLLRGRRGTHNYTRESAPPDKVAATAPYWDGLLYERTDLVVDGHRITAQPWAYREWAAAIAQALGHLSEAEAEALARYAERRRLGPAR